MEISEATNIITADLMGISSKEYYDAFMLVAFSKPEEIEQYGYDPEAMKSTLAAILSEQVGSSYDVTRAAIHSPMDVKAICARNYIVPQDFINSKLSRAKSPLDNYQLAAAVLAYGPDSPRFGDAMAYVLEEGDDVPKEVRENIAEAFKQAAIEENLSSEVITAFQ